jgi:PhnB protein
LFTEETMPASVRPVPAGYHTVTPYLHVADGQAAIEFYKQAFGAKEIYRLEGPPGKIGHAELQIGDSRIMLADEVPEIGARCPTFYGGTPTSFLLYVENVDEMVAAAATAGATVTREVQDQFYGDRMGMVKDPFGHVWGIATHIEDVSPEEMTRRMAAAVHSTV